MKHLTAFLRSWLNSHRNAAFPKVRGLGLLVAAPLFALPPQIILAEPYEAAVMEECASLWQDRNMEFVRAGLCPASPLAHSVFSAHSCETSDASTITLSDAARARISAIQTREVYLGCVIDTEATSLEAAARNLVVSSGETGQAVREDAGHVNVRSGPSTTFEVIDEIALGTPITVLERGLNPQGTHRWLRVSYPSAADGRDLEGFVYFRQVEAAVAVEAPISWIPPFEDFPPPTESAADMIELQVNPALISQAPEGLARETLEAIFDEGPNFAETAILTIWGCGTGCAAGGILDLATGVWADLPFIIQRDLGQDTPLLDYQPESSLIVATGWLDDEELGTFPYHWNGHAIYALTDDPQPRPTTAELRELALAAIRGQKYEEAIRLLRSFLLNPESDDARYDALLGIAYAARDAGYFNKGLAAAHRAQEINPTEAVINEYIASLHTAQHAAELSPRGNISYNQHHTGPQQQIIAGGAVSPDSELIGMQENLQCVPAPRNCLRSQTRHEGSNMHVTLTNQSCGDVASVRACARSTNPAFFQESYCWNTSIARGESMTHMALDAHQDGALWWEVAAASGGSLVSATGKAVSCRSEIDNWGQYPNW